MVKEAEPLFWSTSQGASSYTQAHIFVTVRALETTCILLIFCFPNKSDIIQEKVSLLIL